jgi:uncharacterized membrane protein YfcA
MQTGGLVALGVLAGALGGLVGIGGGVVIVPILVYAFGFSQHQAQGTTLALLVPPIGLLAAIEYYRSGYVDLSAAALICAGFFVGGLIGAKFAIELPEAVLRKVFGVVLFVISLKMVFGR